MNYHDGTVYNETYWTNREKNGDGSAQQVAESAKKCPCSGVDLQRDWRDHRKVTDDMVAWLKHHLQLAAWEGIMDVSERKFQSLFNETIPNAENGDPMVCWARVNLYTRGGLCINGFNIIAPDIQSYSMILTDKDGQNPISVRHYLAMKGGEDVDEQTDLRPYVWKFDRPEREFTPFLVDKLKRVLWDENMSLGPNMVVFPDSS
mgnify:CR=1 FL=1